MTRYTKSMREAMEEIWANDITLDEGKMKTIATMFADGKSAAEIAKKMKLPLSTVRTILGEEDIQEAMLWEFSDGQIASLKKDYASLKGAKISLARANQLRNIFDKITNSQLPKLYKADIPFLSAMALSRMIKRGIQVPKGVRLSAFREQTWEQIVGIDEKIQPGFAVRYSLNGKRLVQAYKTQKDAEHRAKILKSMGGVKDVSITKHDLNFKEEDFNIVNELGATTLKEYAEYIEYMAKNSAQAKAIANMFKGKTGGGESKSDGSEVRIDSAKDVESIHKQVVAKYGDDVRVLTKEQDESAFNIAGVETSGERTIEEKIQPYMISYSQYGKHYGFEGGDSLSDIQNKAQKLRKKGFTIDKMGRYNPPLDAKLRTGKTGVVEEKEETEEPKKSFGDIKKETDKKEQDVESLKQQIGVLRQKLEIEKNKAVKPQPNKETGEVPLTIGLAHKLLRDKNKDKDKDEVKEELVNEGYESTILAYLKKYVSNAHFKMRKLIVRKGAVGVVKTALERGVKDRASLIYTYELPPIVSEGYEKTFKALKEKIDIWGIGQQQPAKVRKAMDVARRMSGNYSGAVKEIEKIAKDLSKLPIVKKALLHANEEKKITERGGANTSSKQGSFARSRKPKYRFGYRVAEKEPKGDKELEEIRIRPKNAIGETDLSKSQIKKVHKKADELPKKSFRDKYGKKKGDSVRYAVATNQTKKKLGIENKNHPAKKKWETLTAKKTNKDDTNKDILPNYQEPTQKTDPMNIQTKEPEKKRTDNGTKSDKIDVNPRIDYHA